MGWRPTTFCEICGDPFDVYHAPEERVHDGCLKEREMDDEANRALNFLCSTPNLGNTTVNDLHLTEIMEATGGSVMARGYLYNIKTQRLANNVHKISLELANP